MAYGSIHGRKPLERANRISHSTVIGSPVVQRLLETISVPAPADPTTVKTLLQNVPISNNQQIRAVVAIDGSMREVSVRDEFPSATVTFFTFGPVLFKLEALRELDTQPFIAPEDLAVLKNIQRYALALPTRNVARQGKTLRESVRQSLHEFFSGKSEDDESLYVSLRWLMFRQWTRGGVKEWVIPACPYETCSNKEIVFSSDTPDVQNCRVCGKPIYLIDAARFHERIDEDQGAGGISSYVLSLCEQIVLVHLIRSIWEMKPSLLREVLFIKDGPLACFGQIAPFSKPLRELVNFLANQTDPNDPVTRLPMVNVVGLEKTGTFVEHAASIDEHMEGGSILILSNEYIYRYIVPGNSSGAGAYGHNTYWGNKVIFKAYDGNLYVATVPMKEGLSTQPDYGDFVNLTEVLNAIAELRCSMYDNALIPVALANRLVSLSEVPSTRILETFAREMIIG